MVFLKEPHINTSTYQQAMENQLSVNFKTGDQALSLFLSSPHWIRFWITKHLDKSGFDDVIQFLKFPLSQSNNTFSFTENIHYFSLPIQSVQVERFISGKTFSLGNRYCIVPITEDFAGCKEVRPIPAPSLTTADYVLMRSDGFILKAADLWYFICDFS